MTATVHPTRLFVYGTLRLGQANHACFCANATDIVPAITWGRLYALDLGFPALEVPAGHILAQGTDDPLADAATQVGWPEVRLERPEGDWDLIEGELMTFANPGWDFAHRWSGGVPNHRALPVSAGPGASSVRGEVCTCLDLRRNLVIRAGCPRPDVARRRSLAEPAPAAGSAPESDGGSRDGYPVGHVYRHPNGPVGLPERCGAQARAARPVPGGAARSLRGWRPCSRCRVA